MILERYYQWVASCIRLASIQCLIALLILPLCSCGPSRQIQQIDVVDKLEFFTRQDNSFLVDKKLLTTEAGSSAEELRVTIVEYDTATPVDSLTKLPLIKKRVDVVRNKESRKDSEKKQEEHNLLESGYAEQAMKQDSVSSQAITMKEETTIPKQIGNVTKWACMLIGLLILRYIARRFQ